jgi:hypothetical protein
LQAFREAADGIRTHDLLHGKQMLRSCDSAIVHALARFRTDVATALAFRACAAHSMNWPEMAGVQPMKSQ